MSENYKELGELFGRESIWGDRYLPCSNRKNTQKGVLWEILSNNQEYEKDIPSLRPYKESYSDFCRAYYDNLPKIGSEHHYTCVPYWGSDYWKSEKRIAIFAQKSLNRDGAGIPLYFPLCEIESWEKAFELGLRLNKNQPTKPFGWQSFMSVWIAMRYIFREKYKYLQQAYYSDIEKLENKEKNNEFLRKEAEIIFKRGNRNNLAILFGKKFCEKYEHIFHEHGKVLSINFPCGQGAIHDPHAETLKDCREKLLDWLRTS